MVRSPVVSGSGSTNDATIKRTLYMSKCSVTASSDGCERSYRLYVPTSLRFEAETHQGISVVPLVFAVHCLYCTSEHMMHFIEMANTYSFVLVLPIGTQRSWNAKYCCGYALKQRIDDASFFLRIVEELTGEMPFLDPGVLYALGWSNGGYMITHVAGMFRAVAPISGHVYDGFQSVVGGSHPVGLFLHHGAKDNVVRITGCCKDPSKPPCCCGISARSESCVSADQVFHRWGRLIGCNGTDFVSLDDEVRGITCRTFIDKSCRANATFCVHHAARHFRPSLALTFPMADDIGNFFAREACEDASKGGGVWSTLSRTCSCGATSANGTYCLGRTSANYSFASLALDEPNNKSEQMGTFIAKDTIIACLIAGLVLAAVTLLLVAAVRKSREDRKYGGWAAVAFSEDEDDGSVELRGIGTTLVRR